MRGLRSYVARGGMVLWFAMGCDGSDQGEDVIAINMDTAETRSFASARDVPRGWILCLEGVCPAPLDCAGLGEAQCLARFDCEPVYTVDSPEICADSSPPKYCGKLPFLGCASPVPTGRRDAGMTATLDAGTAADGVQACPPFDARAVGSCKVHRGYTWNGQSCEGLGGCSCEGVDCNRLYDTFQACEAAQGGCRDSGAPEPCGLPGTQCCPRRLWFAEGMPACESGLECSASNNCCAVAGGPRLDQPQDCCPGWVWDSNYDCRVPEFGTCAGPNDCLTGLICFNNECRKP
jgi:hypothetical protein